MKQWLSIGDRIQVSDEFFWAKGATGRIAASARCGNCFEWPVGRWAYPSREQLARY
jgi:hypothetical protein